MPKVNIGDLIRTSEGKTGIVGENNGAKYLLCPQDDADGTPFIRAFYMGGAEWVASFGSKWFVEFNPYSDHTTLRSLGTSFAINSVVISDDGAVSITAVGDLTLGRLSTADFLIRGGDDEMSQQRPGLAVSIAEWSLRLDEAGLNEPPVFSINRG